jgi:hypothetical protein
MLADRRYRYPPTISDFARRYLFSCDSLVTIKERFASAVLQARELGKRRAWSVMAGPAPLSDEAMPMEHGVHGADGGRWMSLSGGGSSRGSFGAPARVLLVQPNDLCAREDNGSAKTQLDLPTSEARLALERLEERHQIGLLLGRQPDVEAPVVEVHHGCQIPRGAVVEVWCPRRKTA